MNNLKSATPKLTGPSYGNGKKGAILALLSMGFTLAAQAAATTALPPRYNFVCTSDDTTDAITLELSRSTLFTRAGETLNFQDGYLMIGSANYFGNFTDHLAPQGTRLAGEIEIAAQMQTAGRSSEVDHAGISLVTEGFVSGGDSISSAFGSILLTNKFGEQNTLLVDCQVPPPAH